MTDAFGDPGTGSIAPDRPRGDAEQRAQVPRDQWDRYLLHHLDGTKPAANKGFTRVSSIKSGLSNQTGIKIWTGEKIVEGLAGDARAIEAALKARAVIDPEQRKKDLRRIADQAFVAGGGKERSGRGTNFHAVTEELNRGDIDLATAEARLSDEDRPSLRRYYEALDANNIQILPEFLERQVLCPYNAAGTFDNMVRWWNPDTEEYELMIGDLKTGRSLDLAWLEILIQLWLYANGYAIWNTTDVVVDESDKVLDISGFYTPMPAELRKDKACIIHVPLDGTATVYILDLGGVREWVEAAVTAKRANAEAKHKVRRLETAQAPTFVAPDRQQAEALALDPALKYHPGVTEQARYTNQTPAGPVQYPTPDAQAPTFVAPAQPVRYIDVETGQVETAPSDQVKLIGDRTFYPTPDAQAQADKAAERTAVALSKINQASDRLAAFSAAMKPNDETPADPPVLDGLGDPLGPLADKSKGERGCGKCGRKGHKALIKGQPNPRCLGDRDPSFLGDTGPARPSDNQAEVTMPSQAVIDATKGPAPLPTTEELAAFVARAENPPDDVSLTISPQGPPPGPPVVVPGPPLVEEPWCPHAHQHEWTAQHPAAPGQWVCAVSGNTSRERYQADQARAAVPVVLAADYADGDDAPPPPATWPAPVASTVEQEVDGATTRQHLATVRQRAIEAGTWSSDLETRAWNKYQGLPQ